jgi:two-component system sensor histidine kinase UhpB
MELHDNVCQLLTSSKLYLELSKSKKNSADELINQSLKLIEMSLTETRMLSHRLTAPILGHNSLIDALHSLLQNISATKGLKVNLTIEKFQDVLPPDQNLALFRIAQEQLQNIVKHSKAKTVEIKLGQKESNLFLVIKDDGVGFNLTEKGSGAGLLNIASRAKMYGGKMEIKSSPGNGFELWVWIPR